MQVTAKLNYLRIAPRKVRLVADMIRRKKVDDAKSLLNFSVKNANRPMLKLLDQAVANAKNNFQLDPSNLFISKIMVDEGPKYKRFQPRARGQAFEIQKKTSHILIVLDEVVKSAKPAERKEITAKDKEKKEEIFRSEKPAEKQKVKSKKEEIAHGAKKATNRIFRRKTF